MAASNWLQNKKDSLHLLFFHCRLSESRRYGRSRIAGSEHSHLSSQKHLQHMTPCNIGWTQYLLNEDVRKSQLMNLLTYHDASNPYVLISEPPQTPARRTQHNRVSLCKHRFHDIEIHSLLPSMA